MEESGISRAVVMGRKADEYGEVDNEDILELARAYPQTFIPFAGLNPYDADLPDRVDALARQGFRGVCLDGGWRCPSPATVKREGNAGSKTAE